MYIDTQSREMRRFDPSRVLFVRDRYREFHQVNGEMYEILICMRSIS